MPTKAKLSFNIIDNLFHLSINEEIELKAKTEKEIFYNFLGKNICDLIIKLNHEELNERLQETSKALKIENSNDNIKEVKKYIIEALFIHKEIKKKRV